MPISDEMIIEKEKEFGAMLGICEQTFSYSRGWLDRFKTLFLITIFLIIINLKFFSYSKI